MPEEQRPETKSDSAKAGYYKDTRGKVADFFIGFVGCPLLIWLGIMSSGMQEDLAGGVGAALAVILMLAFLAFATVKGRKFIAIGIGAIFLLPVLIAGSCLLGLMTMKGGF